MTEPTTIDRLPDALAVRGMSDGLKASLIGIFQDAADHSRQIGRHADAERYLTHVERLQYGGTLDLSEVEL